MSKAFARLGAVLFGLMVMAAAPAVQADEASPADMARFIAGMEPSAGSPLQALTQERSWRAHSKHFKRAWQALDQRQLSKIASWQNQNLPEHRDLMLYLFSGPDFLYANAFFPDASTYVLTGLEPVGPIPDVTRFSRGGRAEALRNLRVSMQTIVNISFFITKKMKQQLKAGGLDGTLPVLYVFLARAGKTITDVELVTLNPDGTLEARGGKKQKGSSPGVKITFSGSDGTSRTLYYFSTDLSNWGLKKSGFLEFVEGLGSAGSLVKSASYLLHSGNFTTARDFLFRQSDVILQDDSGIPLRHFDRDSWKLQPFGNYLGPIEIFASRYQRDMKRLFSRANRTPIDFGFGYKWRKNQSNVLLATRRPVTD